MAFRIPFKAQRLATLNRQATSAAPLQRVLCLPTSKRALSCCRSTNTEKPKTLASRSVDDSDLVAPGTKLRPALASIDGGDGSRSTTSTSTSSSSTSTSTASALQTTVKDAKQQLARLQKFVMSGDPRTRGLIMLNGMTLLLGSNWVVVKQSEAALDPYVFTSLRFSLAAALFVPFLQAGWRSPAVRRAGLELGFWSALGYLTQAWALISTDASRASLLSTFTVIGVPMLAGLSGKRIKPLVWACGALAIFGTSLLEQSGAPPAVGDAVSILSALFFAAQIFRSEEYMRALPPKSSLPLLAVTMMTVAVACNSAVLVTHLDDARMYLGHLKQLVANAEATHVPVWQLLYTAWMTTDVALLIELLALQDVSSTEAALVYSLEPISGALFAYAFLGERWGTLGWVGAAIILISSVATQLSGTEEKDLETDPAVAEDAAGAEPDKATNGGGGDADKPAAAQDQRER